MFTLNNTIEAAMKPTHRTNSSKPHVSIFAYMSITFAISSTLLLGTASNANAQTTFQGKLNTVSITDSLGTNNPPIANFTYTIIDNIIKFDASQSTDQDGNVVKYNWDFGDGTSDIGAIVTHQFPTPSVIPVTLTIVDDGNSITITQQQIDTNISALPTVIASDDFSSYPHGTLLGKTDKWSAILSDAISLESKYIRGYSSTGYSFVVYTANSFSANQYSEVEISAKSSLGSYGCSVRSRVDTSGTVNAYGLTASVGTINLFSYSSEKIGAEYTLIAKSTKFDPEPGDRLRLEVSGSGLDTKLNGYIIKTISGESIKVFDSVTPQLLIDDGIPGMAFYKNVANAISSWSAGNL